MIAVENVTVRADRRPLLHEVGLTVERGEWVSVLGPNGAGKTTLVRALAGLVPYSGRIVLAGDDRADLRHRARSIAVVPQQPVIPHEMTVAEYVLLGRTAHIAYFAQEGAEDTDAAAAALRRLGLTQFADRRLGSLSGGELQRTVIARALAQATPVLVLDEPTTALDIGHQQEVLELVEELRRELALTVVATMHDLSLASQYGDRVVLLDGGRVLADGVPADVLTEDRITELYGASVRLVHDGDRLIGVLPLRP